jgi:hypothetical protein
LQDIILTSQIGSNNLDDKLGMEKSIKGRANQYHFHLPNLKKAMVMGRKLALHNNTLWVL